MQKQIAWRQIEQLWQKVGQLHKLPIKLTCYYCVNE